MQKGEQGRKIRGFDCVTTYPGTAPSLVIAAAVLMSAFFYYIFEVISKVM